MDEEKLSMNKIDIEKSARTLLYEVWSERKLLWPFGVPEPVSMLDPRMISRMMGLEYEVREHLNYDNALGSGNAVAGMLDWDRGTITVSAQFSYHTQRYTAAHEIGHCVLHPQLAAARLHRDRPISDGTSFNRPHFEQEADYFAACLLMPRKLLEEAFVMRFGTRKPLPRTETVVYHLHEKTQPIYLLLHITHYSSHPL
jgi:IrrE N-terminal-like domain